MQPFIDASTVTFSQKSFVKTVEEVEDGETLTDSEFELDDELMCGQYLCDKYRTYQFLCVQ